MKPEIPYFDVSFFNCSPSQAALLQPPSQRKDNFFITRQKPKMILISIGCIGWADPKIVLRPENLPCHHIWHTTCYYMSANLSIA